MNKTVGGKQFTIFWHVEDLKISHVNPKVVEKVLSQLTTKYVKVSALTVRLGRVHNYLGVRVYYGTKGKLRITVPKHIEVILEEAAKDMDGVANNLAANHMY